MVRLKGRAAASTPPAPPSASGADGYDDPREWYGPLAAFILTLVLYARSLFHPLIWDDVLLVARDPDLGRMAGLPRALFGSFWSGYSRMAGQSDFYRPVASLSLWIDRAFWGPNAMGFHLTNILAAGLGAALLAVWMRGRGAGRIPAALGAAVFAASPLRVEAVAFVADRTDLFCLVFLLLFLLLWPRPGERARPGRMALALLALLLAAGSKELALLAPLALWWEGRADPKARPGSRAPAWAWTLVPPAIYLGLRARALAGGPGLSLPAGALPGVLPTLALYGRLLAWPFGGSADYGYPPHLVPWEWALGAVGWGSMLALAIHPRSPANSRRAAGLAMLFILPGALPGLCATRFLYVGEAFGAAALAFLVGSAVPRRLSVPALAALALALGAGTWIRLPVWESSQRLFEDSTRKSPGSPGAWINLALAQLEAGRLEGAGASLGRALELAPGDPRALDNLAILLQRQGRFREAEAAARRSLAAAPGNADAHFNLGSSLLRMERFAEAAAEFQVGLALREDARARLGLAQSLSEGGDHAGALKQYREYLRLVPSDSADTGGAMAWEFHRLGDQGAAERFARRAAGEADASSATLYGASVILLAGGGDAEAAALWRRALAGDSTRVALASAAGDVVDLIREGRGGAAAHFFLGLAAGRAGLVQARAREARRYLQAEPGGPFAREALAWAAGWDEGRAALEARTPGSADDLRLLLWGRSASPPP